MTGFLRDCPPALALALEGGTELWSADLFQFTLSDGLTNYFWATWNQDLNLNGQVYSSRAPWLKRSKWNVDNTMTVPTLTVYLMDPGGSFQGGAAILTQISQGLFDGASFLLSRAYMVNPGDTSSLGAIPLFGGEVAGLDLIETVATIQVKGKVNKLDQYCPRNVYQVGCNHAFCDLGCTLSRAGFTTPFTMGAGPTSTFVPWPAGGVPANPSLYIGGTCAITGGASAGSRRTVVEANSSGLQLVYPLYQTPSAGDGFTAFQGCDKTFNSGSGRSCTDRSNTQNYRGFEFTPPPNTGG